MVAEDKGCEEKRVLHMYRQLNCLQWLRLVERLLRVQMVATVALVARNRETYTCTVEQIVVVVAVLARRDTSTQIVAVLAINQSIKTPFTRESTVYTGLDKFLNGRIVSLCNPFTRNRANSVTVLLVQVR